MNSKPHPVTKSLIIPDWEKATDFDPVGAKKLRRHACQWVTLDGSVPRLSAVWPGAQEVLTGKSQPPDPLQFPIRDPIHFVANGLKTCEQQWVQLLNSFVGADEVLHWIRQGVDITQFFRPFKGNFGGIAYDSKTPEKYYRKNSDSCRLDPLLVAHTLEERIKNGSMDLIGHIYDISPLELPICIMPLTLDKEKLRLCHDERYLNLFIKDNPFQLDTLKDVPRIVRSNDLLINTDEKSGYDHVQLSADSRQYFGAMFAGWVLKYNTLPFGWKAACFVYQKIGLYVSVFLRNLGIPVLQYIDDRLFNISLNSNLCNTNAKLYAVLQLLTSLGYTLSVHKSVLVPSTTLTFLGFIIDTKAQAFKLPEKKRESFKKLREAALKGSTIDLITLQRLSGKCSSMTVCIPGALFYIREMNQAISQAQKSQRPVQLTGTLRAEIEHWRFLDSWQGQAPWRRESHTQITIATDASSYKWAGHLVSGTEVDVGLEVHDYFTDTSQPIHVKEAEAVLKTIQAFGEKLRDSRVDILSDNQALVAAWQGQGSKSLPMNDVLKSLFQCTMIFNLDLKIQYINTHINPADAPSRSLSRQDATLSEPCWREVDRAFGPHTCDLMSLDSNAMVGAEGPLKHFTPFPTPFSAGVNLFAQKVENEINPYVFPPFTLIPAVLGFLRERKLVRCTVVLPVDHLKPSWWPLLQPRVIQQLTLGEKGTIGVLKYPTKHGWQLDQCGLPQALVAFRLSFER